MTTPRVPSEPTTTPRRSRPIGSGAGEPNITTSPSAVTISTASTWLTVEPSARQCGPPELLATFPPMVQAAWEDGSGAKCRPSGVGVSGEIEVDHTGADPCCPVLGVHLVDAVHPGEHDQHRRVRRHRTARQPGPGTPRDDRYPVICRQPDQRRHLFGASRGTQSAAPARWKPRHPSRRDAAPRAPTSPDPHRAAPPPRRAGSWDEGRPKTKTEDGSTIRPHAEADGRRKREGGGSESPVAPSPSRASVCAITSRRAASMSARTSSRLSGPRASSRAIPCMNASPSESPPHGHRHVVGGVEALQTGVQCVPL